MIIYALNMISYDVCMISYIFAYFYMDSYCFESDFHDFQGGPLYDFECAHLCDAKCAP